MWRVQSHADSEAFAQIVHRWQGPIRNLCLRMTADLHRAKKSDAEDFAQGKLTAEQFSKKALVEVR